MILRLTIAALIILATGAAACADPITGALFGAAFASTLLGSVVSFVFTAAAMVGGSLLLNAIKPKPKASTDTAPQPGIQFDVQMGDDVPIAFTVGTTATAGTRKYIGTWGQDGATPNAYLTDVIQIGDLPAPGELGLWINDTYCTIEWDAAPTPQGYPVTEFRVNGRDHLWVRYRDGTQTVADPFLLSKFGDHPDMPWLPTMIGRGCPYFTMTALLNRELFSSGNFTYLAEPPETPWYDVRKDSTAGGDGPHRWNDPTTWEPTSNNALIIYNIVRGVYYSDEWVYGGQDLAAFRLPADNFMAAMNECDADRELDGGGTEPQYRCGMEIRGDMEPLTVIEELKKGCSGRVAEVGGIFKLLVGAPGSAVYAFTDGDILVTRGQSLAPFPTLDDTHNAFEATYPEPEERWGTKDAPARYSDELEAADDNRRLAASVHFAAVPFPVQVQQLLREMAEEARRFRGHSFHLPPDAYPLEPNDVVSYTSVRNSYLNKKFLVRRIVGERTSNQLVLLKEINPADFGLPPDQQIPVSTGPIASQRPPAQPMVGWQAVAAAIVDTDGVHRKPSIQVRFDGNQDDVRAVRVQVRLTSDPATLVFDGELPYGAPLEGTRFVTLNAIFLPATAYEVRGMLIPYSGRETLFSAWIGVTTQDIRTNPVDLDNALNALLQRVNERIPSDLLTMREDLNLLAQALGDQVTAIREAMGRINIGVGSRYLANKAVAELAMTASTTANSALAAMFGQVYAVTDEGEAEGLIKFVAASAPDGVAASFAIEVRATTSADFSAAGLYLDAGVTALGGGSRIRLVADAVMMENPSTGAIFNALLSTISDTPPTVPIVSGTLTVDLSNRQVTHKSLITAAAQIKFPTGAKPGLSWTHTLEQDSSGSHAITFDTTFIITPTPVVSQIANTITILRGEIVDTSVGPRAILTALGGGTTNPAQLVFYNMIQELGLHTNILTCVDAGSSASWDTGVSSVYWRDLTGQGRHLERGAGALQPTFNGTIGQLTTSEFFSSDGGDQFDYVADAAWQALHKSTGRFTAAFIVRVPFVASPITMPLFDTSFDQPNNQFKKGIWLALSRLSDGKIQAAVNNIDDSSGTGPLATSNASTSRSGLTDKFIFFAVSYNYAAGTNGLIFRFNNVNEIQNLPGGGAGLTNNNNAYRSRPRMMGPPFGSTDFRVAAASISDRAFSTTEFDQLYARIVQSGRWPDIT